MWDWSCACSCDGVCASVWVEVWTETACGGAGGAVWFGDAAVSDEVVLESGCGD